MIIHSFEIILKNALDDTQRSVIFYDAESDDYFVAWQEALDFVFDRLNEKDSVWFIDRIGTYR